MATCCLQHESNRVLGKIGMESAKNENTYLPWSQAAFQHLHGGKLLIGLKLKADPISFSFFPCCRSMSFSYCGDGSILTHIIPIYDCVDHFQCSVALILKNCTITLVSALSRTAACTIRLTSHWLWKFHRGQGNEQQSMDIHLRYFTNEFIL